MSYYTQLQLTWEDGITAVQPLTTEGVVDLARGVVERQGWSAHVLEDLRAACQSSGLAPPGFNGLCAYGVILLIREISAAAPQATFYARGCGEAHADLWLRTFQAGQVIVERGPFDELEEPVPEALLQAARAAAADAEARASPPEPPGPPEPPEKRPWFSRLLGPGKPPAAGA